MSFTTLHIVFSISIMTINLLAINAKGLNQSAKRASLWKTALSHGSDVLCVQETHFAQDATPHCQHKSFLHIYKACYSRKPRVSSNCYQRHTESFQLQTCILDPQGRFIILVCLIDNGTYTIVTVYAPNHGQVQFL